jgi:hypothetical protein
MHTRARARAFQVSLFVPSINIVFSLMGSTASAFVCYVLPAMVGKYTRL